MSTTLSAPVSEAFENTLYASMKPSIPKWWVAKRFPSSWWVADERLHDVPVEAKGNGARYSSGLSTIRPIPYASISLPRPFGQVQKRRVWDPSAIPE